MYLSRLKLNPSSRKTREMLINPYTLHQAVFRAFPDKADDGPGRLLYRIDQSERAGTVSLLVQSEKVPDWNRTDYLNECLLEKAEYKPFFPTVAAGQKLFFRLRANPSVKKQAESKKNGYRVGVLREQDQLKWLSRKAEEGGFALLHCRTVPEGIIRNEGHTKGEKLRHYAVCFEGALIVVAPDPFLETLKRGIGSAKGFGFGLLSIAPLKE